MFNSIFNRSQYKLNKIINYIDSNIYKYKGFISFVSYYRYVDINSIDLFFNGIIEYVNPIKQQSIFYDRKYGIYIKEQHKIKFTILIDKKIFKKEKYILMDDHTISSYTKLDDLIKSLNLKLGELKIIYDTDLQEFNEYRNDVIGEVIKTIH